EGELALRPGDRLFLYSDGVLEAFNGSGEQFGAERLRGCVLAGRGGPLGRQVGDLVASVRAWAGGSPQDDVSVLAVDVADGGAACSTRRATGRAWPRGCSLSREKANWTPVLLRSGTWPALCEAAEGGLIASRRADDPTGSCPGLNPGGRRTAAPRLFALLRGR